MPRHYQSVRPVTLSGVAGWRGLDLYFERVVDSPPEDRGVEQLRRGYELVVQKLHLVAKSEADFMPIFNEIQSRAEASLATQGARVEDGKEGLSTIQNRILAMARRRRGGYFVKLLLLGVVVSFVGALVYLLANRYAEYVSDDPTSILRWLLPASLMLPGASLGVVFVGFATNKLLSYEAVGHLDQYDFVPWQRFVWVVLISGILLVALWFQIFVLGVGNVVLNQVREEPRYGLLIGLVCGVSEALVAELLMSSLRPTVRQNTP